MVPPVIPSPVAMLVTVPPLEGLELVTVKLGYVPLTEMPVPAVKVTVWSGAELVIVLDEIPIPVPAVYMASVPATILVHTVPE